MFRHHKEVQGFVTAGAADLFDFLDDHRRFAAHMSRRSWMMGGGRMETSLDTQRGQAVGSIIRMRGRAFGIHLALDEAIVERTPPYRKAWGTLDEPRLLVIGQYVMRFEITPGAATSLRVMIDYNLPARGVAKWLGRLLGHWYAGWCIERILCDAARWSEAAASGNPLRSRRVPLTDAAPRNG